MNHKQIVAFASVALALAGCSTVRQIKDPATLPPDGKATLDRANGAMAYSVATSINASPDAIWTVLTNASAYPEWNTTVIGIDGKIAKGEKIQLKVKVAPDRTFPLTVSEAVQGKRMVWEDGSPLGMFQGVRTFTLNQQPDGSTHFGMSEVLSGGMLGMIEGSLPDFRPSFEAFVADLKKKVETKTL